ncbi:tRNA dimethylallyltransferase, mitochondrial [Fusarium oxysporum f. sp. cubense race 1]|uniref:tRNA dimethylallyltransferase, mitochondrial n=1 Tax=Fusarium oxysporum f. sp. cubense (strain race 1) TaxID=1229664 RepID=N4UNN6_FUSC1|nr:tRNA dimethylallyltransferase, mitochondrial [Fusarium oxysporum f. sp. cubense race 1]
MSRKPPAEPLVVVLGSTGTGKSDQPWDVDDFKREATRTIREIRGRGRLPILVGGSQYYVDPILFKEVILDDIDLDMSKSFPILQESGEVMLHELRKVDPVMADRWHPKDRRKIQRSLEIYLRSGKRASEYYAEQQARKEAAQQDANKQPWENLLFWVYSERDVLRDRLDKRVDKMQTSGLMDEVRKLYEFKHKKEVEGQRLDMTKGIWQSIGYKQFEPYLSAVDEGREAAELEKLKSAGLEEMKSATRRYAVYQTRWIRLKQIPRIRDIGPEAMNNMYLLDSTDVSAYGQNVVEPAIKLTEQFLKGEERPLPSEISSLAKEVLTQVGNPPPKATPCKLEKVPKDKDEGDSGPELGSMFSE